MALSRHVIPKLVEKVLLEKYEHEKFATRHSIWYKIQLRPFETVQATYGGDTVLTPLIPLQLQEQQKHGEALVSFREDYLLAYADFHQAAILRSIMNSLTPPIVTMSDFPILQNPAITFAPAVDTIILRLPAISRKLWEVMCDNGKQRKPDQTLLLPFLQYHVVNEHLALAEYSIFDPQPLPSLLNPYLLIFQPPSSNRTTLQQFISEQWKYFLQQLEIPTKKYQKEVQQLIDYQQRLSVANRRL